MITLKADHKALTKNTEHSYLSTNYASGVSTFIVSSADVFADNDYLLLGEWGSESSEIVQINGTPNTTTQAIILESATKFAHSESTKVSIVKYNQVRFYRTTTATFSISTPLTGYVDIQADDFYTRYYDTTNSTGFAWYIFYNSTTAINSSNSNAIPYADFGENSVKKIFDQFDSMSNTKEVSLISSQEKYSWLNEAYLRARSELNLVNQLYSVPSIASLSIVSGTSEYAVPSDFGRLEAITDSQGREIQSISLKKELYNDTYNAAGSPYYYLREAFIGITPEPTSATTYYIYYTSVPSKLTSLYDNVTLPNNNYYFLVNFMLYKASMKLKRSQAEMIQYRNDYENGLKSLKVYSINQTANQDKWEINNYANV